MESEEFKVDVDGVEGVEDGRHDADGAGAAPTNVNGAGAAPVDMDGAEGVEVGRADIEVIDAEEAEPQLIDAADEDADRVAPMLVLGDEDPRDAGLHERILTEEPAWHGKFLDVRSAQVELPSGRVTGRDLVRHPGAAAVVALTETGKIVLVRQYRTAIDRVTVEIPAGKLDPGEDPIDCARRELLEETGFKAGRMRHLTTIATTPGFCDEMIHIYMATGLTFEGANPDDDEFVNVDLVPVSELIDAVLDGRIEDAKTVVGALACDAISHRL